MRRRVLYGWRSACGRYCLSKIPPDVPLLPIDAHASIREAESAADLRRSEVIWSGPALQERARLVALNTFDPPQNELSDAWSPSRSHQGPIVRKAVGRNR